MKGMSPVTLGVILLALPLLAWLWWTSGADEGAVTAVSRGVAKPYQQSPVWRHVNTVVIDRETEEAAGRSEAVVTALLRSYR